MWSLGCLAYELCALKVPFKAADFPSLYRKITKGQYSDIPSHYSARLKDFIGMCLTVDEEMRPSASELLENSVFQQFQQQGQELGEVNMVDTIRCPKALKFLNARLPKKNDEASGSRKMVTFTSKQLIGDQPSPSSKENLHKIRKIRSEKVIQWS